MLSYLRESRKLLSLSEKICLVIGNESCDLDSAVSALALAFLYSKIQPILPKTPAGFLPMLNIPRKNFPLKTEVTYFLSKYNISKEDLTFKDDIGDDFIAKNSVILVDHHVSQYRDSVVEVFDHRPFNDACMLSEFCEITIEQVGSCATLIGNLILSTTDCKDEFKETLELLYGAIVMDTVNFSPEACRTTHLDLEIAGKIEKVLEISNPLAYRKVMFAELVDAREDITSLTAHQLLHKDMKLISNVNDIVKVGIPGFPISVQEFIRLPAAEDAIREFAVDMGCAAVLLIGMKVTNGTDVARDLGLVKVNNNENLFNDILNKIKMEKDPDLNLKEIVSTEPWTSLGAVFFQQMNIRATRKHILPMVKCVLESN